MDLSKIEQIEVSRSFSRKVQIAQYEPMEVFASYKALLKPGSTEQDINELSDYLHKLAVKAADGDIKKYQDDLILNTPPF